MIFRCERYPDLWVGNLKFQDQYLEVTDPSDIRAIKSSRMFGVQIKQVAHSEGEEPEEAEEIEEMPHAMPGRRVTRQSIGRQQTARERREANKVASDAARASDGTEQAE